MTLHDLARGFFLLTVQMIDKRYQLFIIITQTLHQNFFDSNQLQINHK